MAFSVYRIRHRNTGKAYIGITGRKPQARWTNHVWLAAKGRGGILHRALHKCGRDAFVFEVLETVDDAETAAFRERELIASEGTVHPDGYNLTSGGEMVVGWMFSPEAKARQVDARLRRGQKPLEPWVSMTYRPTMTAFMRLRKISADARRPMQSLVNEAVEEWLARLG